MTSFNSHATPPAVWMERSLNNGGMVLLLLMIAVIGAATLEPRFLYQSNLTNILRNFAFLAIPALGQMMVMIAGGFDLSVGATMALASVVTAAVAAALPDASGVMILVPIVLALGTGALIGALNGALVMLFQISPFMVTLATMSIVTGITLYYTQGIPIYGVPDLLIDNLGRGRVFGFPPVFLLTVLLVLLTVVMQRKTRFGRHLYAVGGDLKAARLSGIPTSRVLMMAYIASGMLAALTGILIAARIGSGQSTIGGTLGLETIAAAVIGGVSLRGGVGQAHLVALAALLIAIIANAMNLVQIDSKFQTLVLGAILIVALGAERILARRHSLV